MIWFGNNNRWHLAQCHERYIRMPIAETNIWLRLSESIVHSIRFVLPNKNSRTANEASCSASKSRNLSPQNHISSEKVLEKSFHHNPRVGSENAPLSARREHPPRLRVQILGVKLGQHGTCHRLDVGDPHAGESGEDEDFDSGRLGDEVVKDAGEWGSQKQEKEPQDSADFESNESEVWERASASQ